MTSPALANAAFQTRTEDQTRSLAKEYNRAVELYTAALHVNSSGMTEDDKVDALIALEGARKAMSDAYVAFRASMKDPQ